MTGRIVQSDYMHWAKFKPPVRFPLTGSEVPHFSMENLGISLADLDMDGASHPRYAPLRERIAARYNVPAEQVVAADGTSMANFLAMAALIEPGDEVLIEHPTYEPLIGAASFLGADIKRFERRAEDGFRIDPNLVRSKITDRTRLIVVTNLHNPSGALADEDELLAIGRLGARVLVDEVYLDAVAPTRRSAVHLGPEFVCTNSLTKVYGLSGLRCGWILAEPELAERMAHHIVPARDVLYLGRGPDFPMALEGALKLKEISYIHEDIAIPSVLCPSARLRFEAIECDRVIAGRDVRIHPLQPGVGEARRIGFNGRIFVGIVEHDGGVELAAEREEIFVLEALMDDNPCRYAPASTP